MFRSASLAVLATACVSSVVSAEEMVVHSHFFREGTVGGLGGVINNAVGYTWQYANSVAPTSVERANGSTAWDWTNDFGPLSGAKGNAFGPMAPWGGAPYADVATAAAWHDANAKGAWEVQWGGSTLNFDTTSGYQDVLDRPWMELTAASAQQFLDIRSQGLTGTFTFQLTSDSPDRNNTWFDLISGNDSYYSRITSVNATGLYFSVDITSALAADAYLELTFGQVNVAHQVAYEPGVTVEMQSRTRYGYSYNTSAVPGVGGVAALAGLGLAGRRRRR